MRARWAAPIRKYWKISEQMMVKYCDLAICDSVNIEKYIHECYDGKGINGSNPKTTFIAYGADLTLSKLGDDDEKLVNWYKEKGLTKKGYYLVVGRFVPENSFEVMIREFMKSKSQKDFAIITNVNDKFLKELEEKLRFKSDKRIKFVGTVYDQELLKKIRENVTDKKAARNDPAVQEVVSKVAEALGDTGRILVRESGTEPVVRVMVEASDRDTCQKYVDEVVNVICEKGYKALRMNTKYLMNTLDSNMHIS